MNASQTNEANNSTDRSGQIMPNHPSVGDYPSSNNRKLLNLSDFSRDFSTQASVPQHVGWLELGPLSDHGDISLLLVTTAD